MLNLIQYVIKAATTGGASSKAELGPEDLLFERDELEALVDEAHKRGRCRSVE